MKGPDKLLKAKVQLILEQPFFATLALNMKYVADYAVEAAITNGKLIRYNPDYVDRLTVEELKTVVAHEVLHTAMLHHTRRKNRERRKWNQAADYAINPLLASAGFKLPVDCLIHTKYQGKSAEQIFSLLPDSPNDENNPNGTGDDTAGMGEVEDLPDNENKQEVEVQIKEMLAQATMVAKRKGKLPGDIERIVSQILQPKIDWRETLARFITEITKNDYSWTKPSTRYLHTGLYLPSLESEETGKVILLVDTSASIDIQMINQFAGEVQDIVNTFGISLQVIYVDKEVREVQEINPDEQIKLQPKGGGGTDFRPGFDFIEEKDLQPKAVVYLTDGECDSFPVDPDYPVLWAQFGNSEFAPPFGEVIQIL